jgi:hypothetical protein
MSKPLLLATALLCAGVPAAQAAKQSPSLPGCVDLSPDRQLARFGSQYLLVRDGDANYRLGFGGGCAAIGLSTDVVLRAEGQDNRLCPEGTRVVTRRATCTVSGIRMISADEYDSYARRGRSR